MGSDYYLRHEVFVDGKKLPLQMNVSFDGLEMEEEELPLITSVYPVFIPIKQILSGRVTFKAVSASEVVNDPVTFMDALGFRKRYVKYNTTTEAIELSDSYDASDLDSTSDELFEPKVPIELRQIAHTVYDTIDANDTFRKHTFRFKAGGDDISDLSLFLMDATGVEVDTFKLELWSDVAGALGTKVVGTNSVTLTSLVIPTDVADWLDIGALGKSEASDLMGTVDLVEGDWYWCVIEALDNDPLRIYGTTLSNYRDSDSQRWNFDTSAWVAADNSMENTAFVLTFTHKYGGHKVVVKSYASNGDTRTVSADGCKVKLVAPSQAPKKSTEIGFEYKSDQYTITK